MPSLSVQQRPPFARLTIIAMALVPLGSRLLAYLGPINLPCCRPLKFSQGDSSGHLGGFGANLTTHDRSQERPSARPHDWSSHAPTRAADTMTESVGQQDRQPI